uniref:NAD(P)/FAD-dependent oxidoreductase n=1 Tax=Rhodococcus qingshengii TaxID=334542 RepID=UPI00211A55ED|nr:FAD-binding oxidoreductase [Rhodococcus qingshengii]
MSPMRTTSNFDNGNVSFWYKDTGLPSQRPPLPGPVTADIAIVGGGLTGLWTAYYLAEARPDLSIVIVEKHFVGFGASGRNGGWLSGEPAGQFRRYSKTHGVQKAKAMQSNMFATIDEVLSVAATESIQADIVKDGLIHVATNDAQYARLTHHVEELRAQGWGDTDLYLLSPSELDTRVRVANSRGGFWTPHCARIHPAKFMNGLAAAVERKGVRIYEDTTAVSTRAGRVDTDRGTISARYVVEALEGYSDSLKGRRRKLMPMNSSMIVTEPLSQEVWSEIGWKGAELVGDMGHSFAYSHRTSDGRIALGGRGVPYNYASSFDSAGRTAPKAVEQLTAKLKAMYPAAADSAIDHTWSGVLGVPRDWCAAVNFDSTTRIGSAGGYVGHGLTGTNLAARTLRDLLLGENTELVSLPWVGRVARKWEVEPVRWLGASALYTVYRRADEKEARLSTTKTAKTAQIADLISGR